MSFCDVFKEFIPIRVDEDIYLRQHEPEKDARPFWEIYYDEENFTYFGGYKRPHDWNEEREIRAEESRVRGFKAGISLGCDISGGSDWSDTVV